MRRQLLPAVQMAVVLTFLVGIAYPLAITGIAQGLFGHQANGSVVRDATGKPIGSARIGQNFDALGYLHPRPSAAGPDGYDPRASAASNLGPSNPTLIDAVRKRVDEYRSENGLGPTVPVPVDAVTASASGLDPDISLANANLQAARIATARHLKLATVKHIIRTHQDKATAGVFGQSSVNVLAVNIALDDAARR